ncbi:MAG: hypothetical protein JRH12_26285 [Deltaproteobacteria bacterium]|jgi:hypothetical protein|nr:hypothetical protein [Deltaproteobacteria bacterium]
MKEPLPSSYSVVAISRYCNFERTFVPPLLKGVRGISLPPPISIRIVLGTFTANTHSVRRAAVMKGYRFRKNYQVSCAKSNNYQAENLDLKNAAMLLIHEPKIHTTACKKRDKMIYLLQNPVFTEKDGVLCFVEG